MTSSKNIADEICPSDKTQKKVGNQHFIFIYKKLNVNFFFFKLHIQNNNTFGFSFWPRRGRGFQNCSSVKKFLKTGGTRGLMEKLKKDRGEDGHLN